jgi:hypothetical protein
MLLFVGCCYILWVSHTSLVRSPADGHMGCLQFGGIIDKVVICVTSLCGHILLFLSGKSLGLGVLVPGAVWPG